MALRGRLVTAVVVSLALLLAQGEANVETVTVSKKVISSSVDSTATKRETEAIKSKLEKAESHVRELIRQLDSFTLDASNAKAEIHSSLMETWQNVEHLARDRCGSEIEIIRVAQRKAESRVAELEDEARLSAKQLEDLNLRISKASNSESTLKAEITTERGRREEVESEVRELRDKLHWVSAVANETKAYELVAERLQSLRVVVSERSHLTQRIYQLLQDHNNGFDDWRSEIEALAQLVRDASDGYQVGSAGSNEAQLKRIDELEKRLREAHRARDDAITERNALRASYDKLHASKVTSARYTTDRLVYDSHQGTSVVGVFTACVMTLLCGIVVLLFCGWGAGPRSMADGTPANTPVPGKYMGIGRTPERKIPSGLEHTHTSAITAADISGQRNSTPRRF